MKLSLPIIPLIESASGLWHCEEIAAAAGVVRLAFGSVDFQLDLGICGDQEELLFARSQLVLVSRVKGLLPPVDGVTVALTGFMTTAYSGASTTTVGDLMELDAIAACVIGGTALRGGRGSVGGVIFGALIMTALLNGMTLLAVSPEIKFIARGVVLTIAVWLDIVIGQSKD